MPGSQKLRLQLRFRSRQNFPVSKLERPQFCRVLFFLQSSARILLPRTFRSRHLIVAPSTTGPLCSRSFYPTLAERQFTRFCMFHWKEALCMPQFSKLTAATKHVCLLLRQLQVYVRTTLSGLVRCKASRDTPSCRVFPSIKTTSSATNGFCPKRLPAETRHAGNHFPPIAPHLHKQAAFMEQDRRPQRSASSFSRPQRHIGQRLPRSYGP